MSVNIRYFFISLILFLLLWEWMRPLFEISHMTDLYRMQPVLIAIGSFVFLNFLRCPHWASWPIKMLICLSIISFYFHQSFLFELQWWNRYIGITIQDAANLFQGNYGLSAENRTLLFLIGWAMMISVVQSLMIHRQSGGLFITATILYLIILQLWAGLDTTAGVMRSFGLGLILLSILNFSRLQRIYKVNDYAVSRYHAWFVASFVIIAISLTTGIYFSKSAEQEISPIQWKNISFEWTNAPKLQSNAIFTMSAARSGYGDDDSKLGGSVERDEEIVFIAKTEELAYWRGEAKSYYDGKGWIELGHDLEEISESVMSSSEFDEHAASGANPRIIQEVLMSKDYKTNLLFTGGLNIDFQEIITNEGDSLPYEAITFNPLSGRYNLDGKASVSYYKLHVLHDPQTDIASADSSLAYDLQLPDSLPVRIKHLAEQIAETEHDPFQKAIQIESYLKANYTYNLSDPVYPEANQDFVDHFLFEQGFGYCDYFSTAMVVMLRSLGIPARWVKGYAPGEIIDRDFEEFDLSIFNNFNKLAWSSNDDQLSHTVVVRNSDAHSWVEAYFPERGWVSFEPTPGFDQNLSTERAEQEAVTLSNQTKNVFPEQISYLFNQVNKIGVRFIAAMLSVLLIMVLALWSFRRRWSLWRMIREVNQSGNRSDAMDRLFERLWLKTFHRYGSIRPAQTVREYIEALDIKNPSRRKALAEFVNMYESVRYNNLQRNWISKERILRVWKKI